MIVSIHQPNFLPWIGYFYKIYSSDIFVILDTAQYEKNSFSDRNSIKTSSSIIPIKLPVKYDHYTDSYRDVVVKTNSYWIEKTLRTLEYNYKKARYFNQIYEDIQKWLNCPNLSLSEYNSYSILDICNKLGFGTQIRFAHDLNICSTSTQRLIDICKYFNADVYLSGKGGSKYQDENEFFKNNIFLQYTNFSHPVYNQLWNEFSPNLSIVDLLFNEGYEQSSEIIKNSYKRVAKE